MSSDLESPRRIVVTGATGTVGSAVLASLLAGGHDAAAAVRHPDTRDLPDGARAVAFDFTRPETFAPALRGADALFLMRPPASGAAEVNAVVDAAETAGVRRIAFLSVLGAASNPLLPHRTTERRLEASPVEALFLRAAYFVQNLTDVHAAEVRAGEIRVPAGGGDTSFVDARDVGACAARWLASDVPAAPDRDGVRAWGLTGPAALSFDQVAAILSDVLGRRVRYGRPGALAFVRERIAAGDAPAFVLVQAGLYTATRLGLADRVTDTVVRVLGRPARSLPMFAREHAEVWK